MDKLSDLRLSKNMKYTALYVAMRCFEHTLNIYEKTYSSGDHILIDSENQCVFINGKESFYLDTHESFVKLECIDRLLSLGYSTKAYNLCENQNEIIFNNFKIKFIVWDDAFPNEWYEAKTAIYKSRLVSGVLEYKTKIFNNDIFDYGLFEEKDNYNFSKQIISNYNAPDFIIEENRVVRYTGKSSIVIVPDGIEELESSAFWDNQYITEVVLPNSLRNMGGDTFYNCKNLKKVNIPQNVLLMGNNPFAGCPLVQIENESKNYIFENGLLYTADKKILIYCSIIGEDTELNIPEGVIIISKHAFFLCDRFEKITLPSTLEKMENNPFSGCSKLELINHSSNYYIQDDVIYNRFKTAVVGTLNRIHNKKLVLLEGIKTINRNSFWNCKGIETIVFPSSLEDIGYNPFVECSNIKFESKSPYFKVVDDILYNKDCSKLICCPAWRAKGEMFLPDSVITLERGAFSGCKDMTAIYLHNVNIINKSCFTNCASLTKIYCADWVTYIGEWAFAYCKNLQEVSIKKGTIVDNNALSNCSAKITERNTASNYLIESDNIYTLKALQKAYKNKIDSILIDPPYNSHINYIGYKDSNYDDYVEFMQDRISLAYNLLSSKGFMAINIDEGELEELKHLCDSIFGSKFVSVHRWKKKHPYFDANRVVLNPNKIQTDFEYIIICRKSDQAVFKTLKQPFINEDGGISERIAEVPETFDCFGTTSSAKDEINDIFGRRDYFSTPKPVKLMKELIRATTDKDSLIMDFFAGSGTVGHACEELNSEDGGSRHYILVSNNESNICEEVTAKRLAYINAKYLFVR